MAIISLFANYYWIVKTKVPNMSVKSYLHRDLVWKNIILITVVHILGIYGLYCMCFRAKWLIIPYTLLVIYITGLGITAGAHRYWTHRTYKARLPLKILLALLQTAAMETSVFEWVRDHRVHHKFSDTNADPHNATRGLFFSHMGWLMVRKHPDVLKLGKSVDLSDITSDPVAMTQHKLHPYLAPILSMVLPCLVPCWLWGEDWWVSWMVTGWFKYCVILNGTWAVNSFAHIYGYKPYDKRIKPSENPYVAFAAFGEGWHNYHHAFPWDYKTGEFGEYRLNWTTAFIDFMAWIGWAYDRKLASPEMIQKRIRRTGMGSENNDRIINNTENNHYCNREY